MKGASGFSSASSANFLVFTFLKTFFFIGSSVNRYLIEGLAKIGQGEPFVVTDPKEAASVARRFRKYIEAPVLTDIKIHYDGWDTYDTEPTHVPDLFARRPIIVSGKWRDTPSGKVRITGKTGQGAFSQIIDLKIKRKGKESALPYLWARTRLGRLSDFNPNGQSKETTAEITSLGLTYHLLTPFTAFVAVDETIRNPNGAAEDVKQPLPLPKGVSNLAVGSGHSVPEPDLWLMVTLLCLGFLAFRLRPKRKKLSLKKEPPPIKNLK